MAQCAFSQPRRRLPLQPGVRARHAPRRQRQHRQHRVDLGPARQHPACGLRHQQGGDHPAYQAASGKQQAVELGTVGIRSNVIAPGPVDTDMAKLVHSVAIRSDYHDVIPLGRYGTVEEIASAAGFLCSPAAGYINGQVLAVDGGFESAGVGLPTLRRNQQA
jgi:hypothetical protein